MIDREKVREAVDYHENEGYGNHIGILIEFVLILRGIQKFTKSQGKNMK